MTLTFDRSVYRDLLTQAIPKVIESEQEYEQTLAMVESLTFKRDRTAEEEKLCQLLVMLIESYEAREYPVGELAAHEILQHVMESSGTRQADLVGVLGSSGVVSEIVNGKRAISKAQAKVLGDMFKVSPSLFI